MDEEPNPNEDVIEQEETEAVQMEGAYRHGDVDGPEVNFTYGGEKLMRANDRSGENRANSSESVELVKKEKLGDDDTKYSEGNGVPCKSSTNYSQETEEGRERKSNNHGKVKKEESLMIGGGRNLGSSNHGKLKKEGSVQTSFIPNGKQRLKSLQNTRKFRKKKRSIGHQKYSGTFSCLILLGAGMVKLFLVPGAAGSPGHVPLKYDPRCSESESSREDDVLDQWDVLEGLAGGDVFDGSGKNYRKICSNAFHHVNVRVVYLTNNLLQDLPPDIFKYTKGLERLYLGKNKFTSFPPALNSSSDLKRLVLSDNNISDIPEYTMNGLTSLISLDLSGNQNLIRVPEDVFNLLKNHSLRRIILKNTKILHPLEPPPHKKVCTSKSVCHVTHRDYGVVEMVIAGEKATFVSQNTFSNFSQCQTLKEQFEADYEIVNGSISCDENGKLNGSVIICRKSENVFTTAILTSLPEFTTEISKKDNQNITVVIVVIVVVAFFFGAAIGAIVAIVICCFINRKGRSATSEPSPNPTVTSSSSDATIDNARNNISADKGQEQSTQV